jgi:septal ring factor EnvC (AmiA/AmiB activator)
MQVRNTNMLTHVTFSARVEHEPSSERERSELRRELSNRQEELRTLCSHDEELARSEAALEQRLWEVQETRRRHTAMRAQLEAAVEALEGALAPP